MLEHFADEMRNVTVIRTSAGTYIDGEWVPPSAPGEEDTTMIVLPVTAASVKIMAEGSYVAGDKRFYAAGAPRYAQKDIIKLGEDRYEIRDIQDRSFEGSFTIYFAKRIVTTTEDANA